MKTCRKWKSIYSKALGKKVKRCEQFSDIGGDIMDYGYYDDVGDSISSFFEDIGIDLEDIKGLAISGAIGGAGLVGVSALMNKIPQIRKFMADKPLVAKLMIAGVPILLAQLGKRFAPQYSEYLNAIAVMGVGYAIASQLSTGMGIPLAGIDAIEPATEGLTEGEEEELTAIEPSTDGLGDEIAIEGLSDEIDIA
jgi:hypothetical protein